MPSYPLGAGWEGPLASVVSSVSPSCASLYHTVGRGDYPIGSGNCEFRSQRKNPHDATGTYVDDGMFHRPVPAFDGPLRDFEERWFGGGERPDGLLRTRAE